MNRDTRLLVRTNGKSYEIENTHAIGFSAGVLGFRSTDGRVEFQITCGHDKHLADLLESWARQIRGRTVAQTMTNQNEVGKNELNDRIYLNQC